MKQVQNIAISIGATVMTLAIGWFAGANSILFEGISSLAILALVALVIQWVAYIPAAIKQTEKFYDLVGALTFITLVVTSLAICISTHQIHGLQWALGGIVIAWAARLGTYLFRRVHREGKDGRFDLLKNSPTAFLITWTVQGLWTFVVPLPVLVILLRGTPLESMVWVQWVGLAVWAAGFTIETVADGQKAAFRNNPENKGKWINVGLWAKAQHPNYFGEITLWTGLVMVGAPLYEGFEWLAVMSPLVTWVLLTRVSGVPMVRAQNARKWGKDLAYQAYLKEVPMLIPMGRRSR